MEELVETLEILSDKELMESLREEGLLNLKFIDLYFRFKVEQIFWISLLLSLYDKPRFAVSSFSEENRPLIVCGYEYNAFRYFTWQTASLFYTMDEAKCKHFHIKGMKTQI